MIALTQAIKYDSRFSETVHVDPSQIESIGYCIVGERSDGAILTMKSGDKIRVWQTVDMVVRRINEQKAAAK